ncbi:MAG TPA: hypothetical protein DCX41_02925, partial [Aequorivita sp.]|nr:hypothetical protein [Aequorivita sp.]
MAFKIRRFSFVTQLLFLFTFSVVFSQEKNVGVKEIQTLIEQDSLAQARGHIAKNINFYKTAKNYDSLYAYIQFEGSFKLNNGNKNLAVKKAENLTKEIKKYANPHFVVEAITELGWIYDDAGKHQEAYNLLKSAIPFAQKNPEPNNIDLAG